METGLMAYHMVRRPTSVDMRDQQMILFRPRGRPATHRRRKGAGREGGAGENGGGRKEMSGLRLVDGGEARRRKRSLGGEGARRSSLGGAWA
eukprot:2970020-Pleurochrysis_carterae.AAC.1